MSLCFPPQIELVEVSARDGLQNEPATLSTAQKVELVRRSVASGARRVEVTGFARPDLVPALADADDVARAVGRVDGVEISALVVNERSYERALAAGIQAMNLVVVASDTFSRRNQARSTGEMLDVVERLAHRSRLDGTALTVTIGTAFGCPFEGEVPVERIAGIANRLSDASIVEISLADTIGVATPADVTERFGVLRENAPNARTRAHFHDTRHTAVANSVIAASLGVTSLDASVGGVGGCPFAPRATGNVATEDLVYCFERMGIATGLDLATVVSTASWLCNELGKEPAGRVSLCDPFPPLTTTLEVSR